MSYFIRILSGVREIYLPDCPQVFSQLNVRFRDIFERHKGPIQRVESYIYIYIYVCVCVCVCVCIYIYKYGKG